MTRPLVVQQAFPRPTSLTNPYTVLLHDSLDALDDVEARYFSWSEAFSTRFDVYHTHWPEIIVGGRTPMRRLVRQARVAAFLTRLRLSGVPIVRTVHNVGLPSDLTRRERALLRAIDSMTTVRVVLNRHTPVPDGAATVLIPHGHYRDWFAPYACPEPIPGRLAYVGRIRRYKGVDDLVNAFRGTDADRGLSLHVSGYPSSEALVEQLTRAAEGDDRIRLAFAMISDEQLVAEVGSAEVVVLPYPHMHNSGSVLMALSLGRPVLVPDNPVNADLAEEVGPGWVYRFEGGLTPAVLEATIDRVRSDERSTAPDLSARDWAVSAALHRQAYAMAYATVTQASPTRTHPTNG